MILEPTEKGKRGKKGVKEGDRRSAPRPTSAQPLAVAAMAAAATGARVWGLVMRDGRRRRPGRL